MASFIIRLKFAEWKRQRQFTFQEALNKLRATFENVENESDEENTNGRASMIRRQIAQMTLPSDFPYESLSYGDKAPAEEVLSDLVIFEEESDEDYHISIEDGQMSDNESAENEDQEETTAGSAR